MGDLTKKFTCLNEVFPKGFMIPRRFIDENIIHLPTVKTHIFTTTTGHKFQMIGRDDKSEATVTSQVRVQGFRFDPPDKEGIPAFYTQVVRLRGFPIVASAKVNPYALKEAAFLGELMLGKRPDVLEAMVKSGARLCIMAHDEYTTDLPEFVRMAKIAPSFLYYRECALAFLELLRGQPGRAVHIYERAFAREGARHMLTHPIDRVHYARALCEAGRLAEAEAVCLQTTAELPGDEVRYLVKMPRQQLALVQLARGDVAAAKRQLEQLVGELSPFDNPLWLGDLHRDLARVAVASRDAELLRRELDLMSIHFRHTENAALIQQSEQVAHEAESALPQARAQHAAGGAEPERRPRTSRPARRRAQATKSAVAASATSGSAIASRESAVAPAVSRPESAGFAIPPVASPVFARTTAALPLVSPATPPPAMIATGHITAGGTSTITAALVTAPATTVAGPASRSSAWSTPGIM